MRAEDPHEVARALRMRTVLPSNWESGLATTREEGVFASPPVDGWVFVVGRDLAERTRDPAELERLLPPLGQRFGAACWFITDAERDVHGWALALGDRLERGYAYAEEHGHLFDHGDVTDAERALGCFVDDPRDRSDDAVKWWPDRRVVLGIAAAWSLDPSRLDERTDVAVGVGCAGRI